MGSSATKLTLAEYIEWENAQPEKNEFVRGEVFAMAMLPICEPIRSFAPRLW